jgi:hypothetical protein
VAPLNTGPEYMGYAEIPILPRPEVAYTLTFIPLDLPNIDILDKRFCKVLSSQETVQKFSVTQKFKELFSAQRMSVFHRNFEKFLYPRLG